MRNKKIGPAGIFAMRLGFVVLNLLAIWILAGVPEHLDQWWLYILAALGSSLSGLFLLGLTVQAETNPDNPSTRIGGGR